MQYLRNYVSGHFEPKIRIPDIFLSFRGGTIIATTQPTTQNETKEFGWCGIIIGKRTCIASAAKRIASAASDEITFKATSRQPRQPKTIN
jgi:hypothetical protein